MMSQTAEYALRAVVDLAYHFGSTRTTQQIGAATKVPTGYLAKVLQDLAKHRIVSSQRGLGGGFTLSRSPKSLSVLDVLLAVDPPRRIRECPLGLTSHAHSLCPLHQRIDDAMALIEASFRATTIADVTSNQKLRPLGNDQTTLTISGGLSNKPARRATRRGRKPSYRE